jgi:hypothetical protein
MQPFLRFLRQHQDDRANRGWRIRRINPAPEGRPEISVSSPGRILLALLFLGGVAYVLLIPLVREAAREGVGLGVVFNPISCTFLGLLLLLGGRSWWRWSILSTGACAAEPRVGSRWRRGVLTGTSNR